MPRPMSLRLRRPLIHPTGGLAGCAWVASDAAFCRDLHRCAPQIPAIATRPNNRSKFNVALGIEAQGFCLVRAHEPSH
jgi:hypothetical protein